MKNISYQNTVLELHSQARTRRVHRLVLWKEHIKIPAALEPRLHTRAHKHTGRTDTVVQPHVQDSQKYIIYNLPIARKSRSLYDFETVSASTHKHTSHEQKANNNMEVCKKEVVERKWSKQREQGSLFKTVATILACRNVPVRFYSIPPRLRLAKQFEAVTETNQIAWWTSKINKQNNRYLDTI